MNKTLIKSLIRLIRSNMSRFLAVAAIVTIGVAFFTGVSGSADVMSVSVDEYSDATSLKDITVYSNYGFDQEDIEKVAEIEGVKIAEGARFTDVIASVDSDIRVTRIHSINEPHEINQFILVEGRMPENDHEALAEKGSELSPGFTLGSRIEVAMPDGSANENLKSTYYEIVGTIDTPLYLNEVKENSTLSNQYISSYLYINESAFDMDYYTELNVLSEKGIRFNSFSDAYEEYTESLKDQIAEKAESIQDDRRRRIRDEAYEEYEKGLAEYQDGLKEFEEKIKEGEEELADGEKEIREGEEALSDAEQQLSDGINELNNQSNDACAALAAALAELQSSDAELSEKEAEFERRKAELSNTIAQLREGIKSLTDAKNGLNEIEAGLEQIDEALAKLNDEKTVIMIDLLRQLDPETKIEDLSELLKQADEISEQIKELFPDLPDLKIEDLQSNLDEAVVTIRDDYAYLLSEEVIGLIESFRALEEPVPIEDAEIPEDLSEILKRYDPVTEIADTNDLCTSYDNAVRITEAFCTLFDSEEFTRFETFIQSLDPEESLSDALSFDPAEMHNMIALLEENTGRTIETVGDLCSAYDELKESLENTKSDLIETRSDVLKLLAEQNIAPEDIDAKIAEYEELIRAIEEGIASGEAQLADAHAQLNAGYAEYAKAESETNALIEEGRRQLAEGQREIENNRRKIADAKAQLAEGYEQIAKAKTESLEELENARKTLEDAKKEIDSLAEGKWTVLDRNSHYASATYHQTIDQMRAIGDVFPLFFILVAALVCLTTMSRMVSEQRSETGTLRALGYTRLQCASKYLIYAASATLIGCILGCALGLETFPRIIYNAWRMMYILPPIVLRIPWKLVLMTTAMFLGAMVLTAWLVIRSDMKEVPASLMRPKIIRASGRTLIEKIAFIWNRLTFTWKVTMRNIFRYKRRFIMTIIGVAGCCGLMVTGFGIKDSINSMVELQFDEILQFDGTASVSKDCSEEEAEQLIERLNQREDISFVTKAYAYSAKAHALEADGLDETVSVQIFENAEDVKDAYQLRTRVGHHPIELSDEGAVINERLAENLNLKKGDIFIMEDENGNELEVKISDICELYIYHNAFMSEAYYEKLAGTKCEKMALMIHADEKTENLSLLQNDLLEEKDISSISFYDETLENFSSMVSSLDLIVWTLIISSMALAFVVLGNLININVSERQREIATLKVLGFRRKEVQSYIFKENNILTIIGALAGLPLGNYLHHYIMSCIEMDFVMFGRFVKTESFVISAALTIAFGFLVNLSMRRNLDAIAMVESLKSVE
ncbi:MAG: FtsX-like permease family protein [Erysipelotrichaceae bacterium]|nr:FtsX-like permease family protein [Erysipelotrichaceae bacterium]